MLSKVEKIMAWLAVIAMPLWFIIQGLLYLEGKVFDIMDYGMALVFVTTFVDCLKEIRKK